jgi:hypothetical protein
MNFCENDDSRPINSEGWKKNTADGIIERRIRKFLPHFVEIMPIESFVFLQFYLLVQSCIL